MYSRRQILIWKKNLYLIINSFYFNSLNFKFPFMKRLLPYLFIKKNKHAMYPKVINDTN